jgi:hypothetical protein
MKKILFVALVTTFISHCCAEDEVTPSAKSYIKVYKAKEGESVTNCHPMISLLLCRNRHLTPFDIPVYSQMCYVL